ncbi:MAG: M28 family peptidase, partial [Tepidisphaeraceae bacterium]
PHAALTTKAANAAAHGAVGMILVNPPTYHGSFDRLVPFSRQGGRASIPVVQVKQFLIDAILKKAGSANLKTIQAQIDEEGLPHSFAMADATASGKVILQRREVEVKNVMAVLPGYGPRADEYIVVGAHYDHLGRGLPGSMAPRSKAIHHGADDNASGTTAVIELAGKLVRGGRLERSVIFICFTAEEEGLLGSAHFVSNPPVPLEKIVAMLNMDMVGRIRNNVLYVGGTGTAKRFEQLVKAADKGSPLVIRESGAMVGRGGFGPSDHMSFALKKIPVLFFFSGLHQDYHTPTDTADKINYRGLADSVAFAQQLIVDWAAMPRQEYVAAFDSGPSRRAMGGNETGEPTARRATLGVVPDYGSDESTVGVRISGTVDGSPAATAGLKDGDVLVEIGAMKIGSLYDLTDFLAKAKPGDKVKVIVLRDGQRVESETTLAERGG